MAGKRGRPSSADLMVASAQLAVMERMRAPHDLNDEEVEVWSAVTSAEPADWFSPSTAPLLSQYCRHVIAARRVAEVIEKATSDPALAVSDWERLLVMQCRETKEIAQLAVKMRIAQQSTTNHRGNKRPNPVKKPWEG